ncbi:MAG: lysine--tRNA ligase [Parvibaculales bacterium]
MSKPAAVISDISAAKAWPFEEARKVVKRLERTGGNEVLFETGYGPSGLPHIGTFGEVARTSMVRAALLALEPSVKTRLICFSDDMDGLRKVPDNVPKAQMLVKYMDMPLSAIPDPFEKEGSFAAHNNARLCHFLDRFGFEYELVSASQYYKGGRFDGALEKLLAHYDEIMGVILPTLGEERRKNYSPFLPICPKSGKVLMAKVVKTSLEEGTITYIHPEEKGEVTTSVKGGACKLQWKADWAMRWVALGVDYEMAGKDLIDAFRLSAQICKILGGRVPEGFHYELFLDAKGEKISKSKGNGLTIEEWLKYATPESLWLFMFQNPRKAKRLYFDVIPKAVDEYTAFAEKFAGQSEAERVNNPVWHIHNGSPPPAPSPVSFSLLLNLVSASNADSKEILWGFLRQYAPDCSPETHEQLDVLVGGAIAYFHDFIAPYKKYRKASAEEEKALRELLSRLRDLPEGATAEEIQSVIYEIGKGHFEELRAWFTALYEVLLGAASGPRFGSFVALYGVSQTCELIERALGGKL